MWIRYRLCLTGGTVLHVSMDMEGLYVLFSPLDCRDDFPNWRKNFQIKMCRRHSVWLAISGIVWWLTRHGDVNLPVKFQCSSWAGLDCVHKVAVCCQNTVWPIAFWHMHWQEEILVIYVAFSLYLWYFQFLELAGDIGPHTKRFNCICMSWVYRVFEICV